MLPKMCRNFCLVFFILDLQSGLSHNNINETHLSRPAINTKALASIEDTQHQASIRLVEKDAIFGEGHICGGSLIFLHVILTTANCLFNPNSKSLRHPSELYVVLGTLNRYQKTKHTFIARVTHLRYPATFDITTKRDDIGLVFLSHGVPENHITVRPVELNQEIISKDIQGAVTGWGISRNNEVSHQLIAVNVSIMNTLDCHENVGYFVPEGILCAKQSQVDFDICQIETGAPFIHNGKQIGIVSLSNACQYENNSTAVFTDVAYHIKWILKELEDDNNKDSSIWGILGLLVFTWYAFKDRKTKIY